MANTYPLTALELEIVETLAEINRAESEYFQAVYDELLANETLA
jgi:hypothetical protein